LEALAASIGLAHEEGLPWPHRHPRWHTSDRSISPAWRASGHLCRSMRAHLSAWRKLSPI